MWPAKSNLILLKSNCVEIQILPDMCVLAEMKSKHFDFWDAALPSFEQTQFVFNPNCLREETSPKHFV